SRIAGSGTRSTRTSSGPNQQSARMVTSPSMSRCLTRPLITRLLIAQLMVLPSFGPGRGLALGGGQASGFHQPLEVENVLFHLVGRDELDRATGQTANDGAGRVILNRDADFGAARGGNELDIAAVLHPGVGQRLPCDHFVGPVDGDLRLPL